MSFNPLTYNALVTAVENLLVDNGSSQLISIIPQAIMFAEGDLYRSLDMLSDRISDNTVRLVTGTRTATCPTSINIVEGVSVITPSTGTTGKRNPAERASIDFIDMAYPDPTILSLPTWFAMLSDVTMVFASTPDQNYYIEVTGTAAPVAMSSAQQTSPLGNYFPDLLLSTSMIFLSNWQRDFGSQMNPQDSQMWQTSHDMQLKSALEYIQRQKSQDTNWSPYTAAPLSTPRG